MKSLRILLLPFSWLYGMVVLLRNFLFDTGLLKSRTINLPVICIGNLNTGGTGKTPHTEYLLFVLSNFKTAVVSRGYGRNTKGIAEVQINSEAKETGDEPLQIKHKFQSVPFIVSEKRSEGIDYLLEHYPQTEVVLLDDAFQHRSVKAGLNLLLTQFNDLFIHDRLLPAGNLREPVTSSSRADVIIVTKCPSTITTEQKKSIISQLPAKPVFFSTLQYGNFQSLNSDKKLHLTELSEYEILLITGIASNKNLLSFLSTHSRKTIALAFKDHHNYCVKDFKNITTVFNNLASEKKIIVITEKDAVKFNSSELKPLILNLPVYSIPVTVTINENEIKFLDIVKSYVGKNQSNG